MKNYILGILGCAGLAMGQMGRTIDWPTYGNDSQRTGWEKVDSSLTKEGVSKGGVKLLW